MDPQLEEALKTLTTALELVMNPTTPQEQRFKAGSVRYLYYRSPKMGHPHRLVGCLLVCLISGEHTLALTLVI